jgi:hypothetical protein
VMGSYGGPSGQGASMAYSTGGGAGPQRAIQISHIVEKSVRWSGTCIEGGSIDGILLIRVKPEPEHGEE